MSVILALCCGPTANQQYQSFFLEISEEEHLPALSPSFGNVQAPPIQNKLARVAVAIMERLRLSNLLIRLIFGGSDIREDHSDHGDQG